MAFSVEQLFAAATPDTDSSDVFTQKSGASPNVLSSNWVADVKAALPSKYFEKGNPDFHQITNLLCQESQRGNNAAQGLWGLVLVTESQTPEDSTAGLQMLRTSAQNGFVQAMLNLGSLYANGRYVPTNYDETFHWFSLAADKGSSEGQLELGICYHYGLGTPPDLTKAAECYLHAAEETNYVAMKSYGYVLLNGIGVPKDVDTAKYWLTRAAKEGGNRRAMYDLGVIAQMKFPETNAMAEAFQWYQQSAELGDPLACLALADCYYRGWGVEANQNSYRDWRLKAATLGATEAQYRMGQAYRYGDGVPKDVQLSLVWYREAAAKNHPEAFYDLALYYLENKTNRESIRLASYCMLRAAQDGNREAQFQCALYNFRGDLLPQDCDAGKQWMEKAAENGWAKAEFALFQMYYNGIPPAPNCPPYPRDKNEAVKWLRRAAEHGSFQAESTLAVMLIQGTDVNRDTAGAEKLLRDAASHGYAQAQNDLGFALLNGDIPSTDPLEAAMWCDLAASHWPDQRTLPRAEANVSNATSRLTPDQQLAVQQRVKDFQALPVAELYPLVEDWNKKNPDYQQEDGELQKSRYFPNGIF